MQPKISDPIRSAICGTEIKRRPDPKKQPNIVFIEPKWAKRKSVLLAAAFAFLLTANMTASADVSAEEFKNPEE